MNALRGGSAGGGLGQAGQAQAQLGGEAMRQNVYTDEQQRAQGARTSYLSLLMSRAQQQEAGSTNAEEQQRARDLQVVLQGMIDKANVQGAALSSSNPTDAAAVLKTLDPYS